MASKIVEEYGDARAAEALQQGIRQGIEQGSQQKAIEAAKNALSMHLSVEQAAKIAGLPLEIVLELQKKIPVER